MAISLINTIVAPLKTCTYSLLIPILSIVLLTVIDQLFMTIPKFLVAPKNVDLAMVLGAPRLHLKI